METDTEIIPLLQLKNLLLSGEKPGNLVQQITDIFPALIFTYDVKVRKIQLVNRKIMDILGYSQEEVNAWNRDLMKLIYLKDQEQVKKDLEECCNLQGESSHKFNCRFNNKEGNLRYFKTIGTILTKTDSGKAETILFIAEDITERLIVEKERIATHKVFEESERMLKMGIFILDIQKSKLKWSDGLYHIFEMSGDEVEKITYEEFFNMVVEEDREKLRNIINDSVIEKSEFEIEYDVITKHGNLKTLVSRGYPVVNENSQPIRLVGNTLDVTKIRLVENELHRRVRELNQSNKELEEFAYVASHDLQEPLRKITTFSSRLLNRYSEALGEEGRMYIDRMQIASDNMRILIDNLLELSRVSRNSQNFEVVNLSEILKDTISDLELSLEETKTVIMADSLPLIEGIPSQLRQLFNNLLGNAVKFRKHGVNPNIRITVSRLAKKEKEANYLDPEKKYFRIDISDNGIGFEQEYEQRIFQIFQRLHGKSEFPGSGIGLSICKKIAERHNGLISAKGKENQGATFSIILPEMQ